MESGATEFQWKGFVKSHLKFHPLESLFFFFFFFDKSDFVLAVFLFFLLDLIRAYTCLQ